MDLNDREQGEGNEGQEQPAKVLMPTPGDLFRAWKEGGEAALAEMLPDDPDEED